jgi:hypothetical protein
MEFFADATCTMCGNQEPWGNSSWCPKCGYYPRLGISMGPALEPAPEASPGPKSLRDAWAVLPVWARVLAAGVVALFTANVTARLMIPDQSPARMHIALLELAAGLGVFVAMHCAAYVKASMENAGVRFLDLLLHPIVNWQPTIQQLPGTARRVWLGAWGLTAAVCALLVLGGIPYRMLFEDWGARSRVKPEVASRVQEGSAEKLVSGGALTASLDEKVRERADLEAKEAAVPQEDSELEMQSADCVVIGYNVSARDGGVSELLLASLVNGELKYVGSVSEGIPDGVRQELSHRLPELKRDTSFISCPGSGIWVKPIVACKTSFRAWTEDNMLSQTTFKELMAEIGGVK